MASKHLWSRRRFLVTSGLAAAAAGGTVHGLPEPSQNRRGKRKGAANQAASFTRYDVSTDAGRAMLDGYATAVVRLLEKEPEDPLNWYRLVLTHTLDCPHGNWWFLPWHRGYTGYMEQVFRRFSDNSQFAFPYWDWTTHPEVPAEFFGADNPLDPTSSYFISSFEEFKTKFKGAINGFYDNLSPGQHLELVVRDLDTPDKLWSAMDPANQGYFFNGSAARCLTAAQPSFATPPSGCESGCSGTPEAVSPETMAAALAPTDFITFGSGCVNQHSQSTEQGVLESQPHNLVHNCVGGFMSEFMSPVDPVFYLHHSNIERLWLVWTAKQEAAGLPTLPEDEVTLAKWSAEKFLFYVDADGQTLDTEAGDFSTVGDFDYTYEAAPKTSMAVAATRKVKLQAFTDTEEIPADLVKAAAEDNGPELLAHVIIDPKGRQRGKSFHINVNLPKGLDGKNTSQPHHAATVAFFGAGHGHGHGPTTFVVPISGALRDLKNAGRLKPGQPLELSVTVEDSVEKSTSEAEVVRAVVSSH